MNSTPDDPDETPGEPAAAPDPGDIPPPVPPGPVLPSPDPAAGVPPIPVYPAGAAAPPAGYGYPAPVRKPRSFGAGIGIGVGVGCGAYAVGVVLFLGTMGVIGNIFGFLWPFLLIVLVAAVLMFFRRTRPIATGILIVSAAAWIIVIGPCLALMSGF